MSDTNEKERPEYEKEWWEEEPFFRKREHYYAMKAERIIPDGYGYNLPAIIAEAERRKVKEIRDRVVELDAYERSANPKFVDGFNIAVDSVLDLPCLKDE